MLTQDPVDHIGRADLLDDERPTALRDRADEAHPDPHPDPFPHRGLVADRRIGVDEPAGRVDEQHGDGVGGEFRGDLMQTLRDEIAVQVA